MFKVSFAILFTVLFSLQLFSQGTAPNPQPKSYTISRVDSGIQVDGNLDEEVWKNARVIELPYEWFPGDNIAAVVKTECLVVFDQKNLYVGFRAYDPDPSKIRAHYADRDTPFLDDTVGFTLDTFFDKRRGFQFRINALGVQMEAVNSDVNGSEDWAWDAIWDSAGRITDFGYVVEVALPFNQLRFPNSGDPQTWGFLAMRDYPRTVRHRLRSAYFDHDKDCFICQLEPLTGFSGMKPGLNLQLTPTLTGQRTDVRDDFPDGPLVSGDEDTDLGATVRWSVTPNATLNAAVNPDFSQVEADVAQLNVNERFALFFPEKRPFFLEGSDFFDSPLDVVFSRTVADPSAGVKFTAKQGKNALGVFYARDRLNNLTFPSNRGSDFASVDEDLDSGVLRYRRDIGTNSNLGLMYTSRSGEDYHNRLAGVDGNLRITGQDSIRFQAISSNTQYSADIAQRFDQPEGSFDGLGYSMRYQHASRDWFWFAQHRSLEPELRADFGFIPRVDTRNYRAGGQRTFFGDSDQWFRQIQLFISADITENYGGKQTDRGQDISFTYQGPYQTFLEIALAPNDESFDGITYDNFRQGVFFLIRPTGDFEAQILVNWGETIDFANSRQADFITVEPLITLKLGRRFDGVFRHTSQTLDVEGGELFTARLTQANLIYHFNRRTFLRGILQSTDISRDPDLYVFAIDSESEALFTQLLFSYKINPQTVLLAGYSDNGAGNQSIDLTKRDRTVFVKLGYAWVF